jgi:hypothetical protein
MSDLILLANGTEYSWPDHIVKINGLRFVGLTAYSYNETRERGTVYAARRDGVPMGSTTGKYKAEGSLTMLKSSAMILKATLGLPALGSYGDARFVLSVTAVQNPVLGVPPLPPIESTLTGCHIIGNQNDFSEGVDPNTVVLPLWIKAVTENGFHLFGGGLP